MSAETAAPATGGARAAMRRRLLDAVAPALPSRRADLMRRLISAFVVFDVLVITPDVLSNAHTPEFYRPVALAELLSLGPVSPDGAGILLGVVLASAVAGALGIWPRLSGAVMALGFWVWMLYSQGYGYVSHDHMALMVAVAVLATVGPAARSPLEVSSAAGWALRCIQVAVVLTYFYSVVSKTLIAGSPWAWADSAVFAFAFLRRGNPWMSWLLYDAPWLLRPAQWTLIILETLSPLALVLRGRALYVMVGIFCAFHAATFVALGIHFLPTVICWAAFLPLERIIPPRGARARPYSGGGNLSRRRPGAPAPRR